MDGFEGNPGTNKLAKVLSNRMKRENESPLVLDFGEIQTNGSLLTNTFPMPIPKGEYSICRGLTFGAAGSTIMSVTGGEHEHREGTHEGHTEGDGSHLHSGGDHQHTVLLPDCMRSVGPGDRVLVAWVQNEAVVVDIIEKS